MKEQDRVKRWAKHLKNGVDPQSVLDLIESWVDLCDAKELPNLKTSR